MEISAYPTRYFYPITYVGESYPEHHLLPFENTRQKFVHAMHDFFVNSENETYTPRVDIRETAQRYYIDVEVPGVGSAADLSIRWMNSRVIVVSAHIKRTPTAEDLEDLAAAPDASAPQTNNQDVAAQPNVEKSQKKKNSTFHFLKSERRIGTNTRAFEFAVDVDHDTLKSGLHNGLLAMVIDKKPNDDVKNREVKIEQASDAPADKTTTSN